MLTIVFILLIIPNLNLKYLFFNISSLIFLIESLELLDLVELLSSRSKPYALTSILF